jgi:CRISPR-associated protein Csh2
MSEIVQKNSELLYLYDARLCNPNGDPDEENKPRMDYETGRNLASDVRLKRYLRDYWLALSEEEWKKLGYDPKPDVWVRQLEDTQTGVQQVVSAKDRIGGLAEGFGVKNLAKLLKDSSKRNKDGEEARQKLKELKNKLLSQLVDVRPFGATMPVGQEEGKRGGESLTFIGPVQFAWGYSLNQVEILPSASITSHFASGRPGRGEEGERHGTIGKDWRVKYSLLAFYGTVSAWRARRTRLTEQDVLLLDRSLLEALPLLATTRSKLGQAPRLYLRVQYNDDRTFLGDLRAGLSLEEDRGLEDVKDVELNFTGLVQRLQNAKAKIEKLVFWAHPDFASGAQLKAALEGAGLPVVSVQAPGPSAA